MAKDNEGYSGNPLLKKTGVEVEWTPENQAEWMRCAQDVMYFSNNYVTIVTLDDGKQVIKLRGYQVEMVESMVENRNTIVTTARQAGKSTAVVCFMLWYILFHRDKTIGLLANKETTAIEILDRVQLAYMLLPKWLQQGIKIWNKTEIKLENDSCVFASATSSSAVRGYSINVLFIDEAAHIENWDQFFTSVYPTVSSGKSTKVILVSTPNGLNHFYSTWDNAKKGKSEFNPIEVPWDKVPGRDEAWRQKTLSDLNFDQDKFNQEYNCQFLGSSGTLISGAKLKDMLAEALTPLSATEGLSHFEHPQKNHIYSIVADVSRGKGLDYSAFSVIDITKLPYRQVCSYKSNKTTPTDYADTIHRTAKIYNDAYVLVEINDIGEQVSWHMHNEYEYENLLMTANGGRAGKQLSSGFGGGNGGGGNKKDLGIKTTLPVRTVGCSMLKLLVEQNQLQLVDYDTISELATFSKKGNRYEAEPGKHDDLVMGLVLFAWMTNQLYFKELNSINTIAEIRDKTDEEMADITTPFGFVQSSVPEVLSQEDIKDGWFVDDKREWDQAWNSDMIEWEKDHGHIYQGP